MKTLVIGSGAREHALVYFLGQSTAVDRIFWTPGNAGEESISENPRIDPGDFSALVRFAKDEQIDLTVVGPEVPLVEGVADVFSENGLTVFGPSSQGARIEGSKIFAKNLMKKKAIPTAYFREFYHFSEAFEYVKSAHYPSVIKADGLAAGKGVTIVSNEREAENTLRALFEEKVFGESGSRVVIEEFLEGEEATVLALFDGKSILPLMSSQDHKPVHDGDKGPNTGGMGAIAPAPVVSKKVMDRVMDRILLPLTEELRERHFEYNGIIYVGLMIIEENPSVVEFNCRFGDPETEAVLPLLESDLWELLYRTARGELEGCGIRWKQGYACDVVISSGGYPGPYEKGKEISGLNKHAGKEKTFIFHAGTKKQGSAVVTNGGRVLNVVGVGSTLETSINKAYEVVKGIYFENMYYRKDIGYRGLKHCS
jgi:phosphoribosylamine--glycine ligase